MNKNGQSSGKNPLNQAWYVRRGDKITGPFPGRLISRRILLGQILLDDELSLEQLCWQPAAELKELIPDVMSENVNDPMSRERALLSKRWADERSSHSRRKTAGYGADEKGGLRSTTDRRDLEDLREINYREKRDQRLDESRNTRKKLNEQHKRRQRTQGLSIVLLIAGIVIVSLLYVPAPKVAEQIDCMAQPEPEVVWANCQMAGKSYPESDLSAAHIRNANLSRSNLSGSILVKTDLSYANLSYVDFRGSDLSHANLKGANLQKANLKETNLNAADLSYADLTGAKLRGANFEKVILSKTIWVDGRECAVNSVGVCR
ncbi:Pentapeptide repeat family protein [hydrothermal vent metagenome]|uniref:Pentapeptide repeat family protein n=1 Tax=hydrothermal vent metagenome TaxID=652676 RepID=A0A3B0ZE35_9ZZZZ